MIAPENVTFEAQLKDSLYHGKFKFCYWVLRYPVFLCFKPFYNFENYDNMMGLDRVVFIFKYIVWTVNYLLMKLDQAISMAMSNIFARYFVWFGGVGPKL